jgi:hypothetical protein
MRPYHPPHELGQYYDNHDRLAWQDLELQANNMISSDSYIPTQVDDPTADPFQNIAFPFSSSFHATNTTSSNFLAPQQQNSIFFSSALEGSTEPYPYGVSYEGDPWTKLAYLAENTISQTISQALLIQMFRKCLGNVVEMSRKCQGDVWEELGKTLGNTRER